MSSINQRINELVNYFSHGNNSDFASKIGVNEANIRNYIKGIEPKFNILEKIINKFEINYEWLLTGRGEMLKSIKPENAQMSIHKLKTDYDIDRQIIPLYEIEASAGLAVFFNNQSKVPLDYISVPNAPKCDGALSIRGDSMYPLLKAGDIICYKTISNMENLIYGEMYLLDIDNGDDEFLTVKYIQKSDLGRDFVRLVSENRHHAPKDEPIKNIRALAIIKLTIRYNTIS